METTFSIKIYRSFRPVLFVFYGIWTVFAAKPFLQPKQLTQAGMLVCAGFALFGIFHLLRPLLCYTKISVTGKALHLQKYFIFICYSANLTELDALSTFRIVYNEDSSVFMGSGNTPRAMRLYFENPVVLYLNGRAKEIKIGDGLAIFDPDKIIDAVNDQKRSQEKESLQIE